VPVYFPSTTAFSETAASMATVPPNMYRVFVTSTSVTNCQNLLPIPTVTSLITLNTLRNSDTSPEKITACRPFKDVIPVQKGHTKYSISKIATILFIISELKISRKAERNEEEIEPNSKEIRSENSSYASDLEF
jgi:hypothetical protein